MSRVAGASRIAVASRPTMPRPSSARASAASPSSTMKRGPSPRPRCSAATRSMSSVVQASITRAEFSRPPPSGARVTRNPPTVSKSGAGQVASNAALSALSIGAAVKRASPARA